MGLQAPPKHDAPSRLIGRLLVLIVLMAGAGVVIYTAVTNQRVDLIEDLRTVGLDLDDPIEVDGVTVNIADSGGTGTSVVFIHDVDIAGGLTLEPVTESLDGYRTVRIDLPGFGYSDRLPFETSRHTVAGMAETVSTVMSERFGSPAVVVGIGFGGEVAADLAYTFPELVDGVVLVDTDFWSQDTGLGPTLERLPWIGKAATYTWRTGGRFALDNWSPYCEEGGWCPTQDQMSLRAFIVELENTTDSLHEFLRTPDAALAPSHLGEITVPMAYVWSIDGDVDPDTVDRLGEEIPGLAVIESDSFQAHLEDFASIGEAMASISG